MFVIQCALFNQSDIQNRNREYVVFEIESCHPTDLISDPLPYV